MAVVCSKVLLFEPPLIYTAPDTCVFGAVRVGFFREGSASLMLSSLKEDTQEY